LGKKRSKDDKMLTYLWKKEKEKKKVVRKIEEKKTVEELVPRMFWK